MMLGFEVKLQTQELLDLISIGHEVCLEAKGAKSFKVECDELGKRVNRLSQILKTLFCFISSARISLYLRPVKSILPNIRDNFELARAILYKCKRRGLLRRLLTSRKATHFRELILNLDASINAMEWLLIVYNIPQNRTAAGPIDRKLYVTFLVWCCIATVQMGNQLEDRVMATKCLQLLAQENKYKKIICEEGGARPLQKLLKENFPLEAQIMAANALCLLADEQESIMKEMITTIVNRFSRTSPMSDQTKAANLVASIAEHNPELKEYDLITENVIWRLVTLLSSEPPRDNPKTNLLNRKLKISCSKALWMLALGSFTNCRTLTETKGMLCLAKLVETEQDELQYNCLMIIREITAIAEKNNGFRHSVFKSTSPAAMAVVDGLLRVIKEFDDTKLKIPAIKSIGSLARSFSAKETRIISHLVALLDNTNQEVAMEAAIALQKFVCTDNHLRSEHSKSIIEFNGAQLLMKLLSSGDKKLQPHGLALICNLAKHGSSGSVSDKSWSIDCSSDNRPPNSCRTSRVTGFGPDTISEIQSNHTGKNEELDSSPEGNIKQIIAEQTKIIFIFQHRLNFLLEVLTIGARKLLQTVIIRSTKRIYVHYVPSRPGEFSPFQKAKRQE